MAFFPCVLIAAFMELEWEPKPRPPLPQSTTHCALVQISTRRKIPAEMSEVTLGGSRISLLNPILHTSSAQLLHAPHLSLVGSHPGKALLALATTSTGLQAASSVALEMQRSGPGKRQPMPGCVP